MRRRTMFMFEDGPLAGDVWRLSGYPDVKEIVLSDGCRYQQEGFALERAGGLFPRPRETWHHFALVSSPPLVPDADPGI